MRPTRWLRLRIACAVGVLAMLVVELTGHRTSAIELVQLVLIGGIVVTSVLDVRDHRRDGRDGRGGPDRRGDLDRPR